MQSSRDRHATAVAASAANCAASRHDRRRQADAARHDAGRDNLRFVFTKSDNARARTLLGTLSLREREVLDRVVDGMHNREIAVDLGISPRTVEVYRAHLMTKLQARRLADLLRLRRMVPVPPRDTDGSAT